MKYFLDKLKKPYIKTGYSIYIHKDDLEVLLGLVSFTSEDKLYKGIKCHVPLGLVGTLWNYNVFIQDDIQLMFIAMKGGQSIES